MKKFVALIVCCVMLVVALVFDPGVMTNKLSVGAGNGTSVEIENLDDLYNVIEAVYDGDLLSMSEDYELLASSKAKKKKISSITLEISTRENSHRSSNSSYSNSSSNSNSTDKYNTESTVYITKDSIFITTKGSVHYQSYSYTSSSSDYNDMYGNYYSSSSSSSTNYNSSTNFDMDIYIEDDDTALVRFRYFFTEYEKTTESSYRPYNGSYETDKDTDNYSAYVDFEYLNQWIKVPVDVALDLLGETDLEDSIEMLEDYADIIESDELKKKSDGVYTYTDKDDNDYYDRYKLEIKCDFSTGTAPSLESVVDYSYDSYNSGSGYSSSSSYGSRDASNLIVISNINNTKVDLDNIKPDHSFKNEDKFMDAVWRENDD